MNSFKGNIKNGIIWTTIQQIVVVIVGIIKLMVLARLLEKSTFGLFAIITLLIGFTSIFSDLGITVSLYHKKSITKTQYSTLYWINIVLNFILYLALILLTPLFVIYFKEASLTYLIPLTGVNLIFTSLGKHFKVFAEKELRFKEIAIIMIATNIISLIIAIVLASNKFGIYSLIYSILFTSLFSSIAFIFLMYKKYKLSFIFKYNEIEEFFKIGMFQAGSQILDYLSSQIDIIIIGGLLNSEILGVYNLIKQFSLRIHRLLSGVLSKVFVPLFSSFNQDETLIKTRYLTIVKYASLLSSIIFSGFAFMSKEVLFILYGKDYIQYYILFSLFSLIYYIASVITISSILIVAKGKTQYGFHWTIFRIILSTSLILLFGKFYSITGIVIGLSLFSIQSLYSYWYIVIKKVQQNITFKEHLRAFGNNTFMGFIIFMISFSVFYYVNLNFIVTFIVKLIFFAILIISYLFLFNRKTILEIKNIMLKSKKIKS